jgi:hypothetical protein
MKRLGSLVSVILFLHCIASVASVGSSSVSDDDEAGASAQNSDSESGGDPANLSHTAAARLTRYQTEGAAKAVAKWMVEKGTLLPVSECPRFSRHFQDGSAESTFGGFAFFASSQNQQASTGGGYVYSGVFGTPVLAPPARITTPGMVLSNVAQTMRERAFTTPTSSNPTWSSLKMRSDVKRGKSAASGNTAGRATAKPASAAKKVQANRLETPPGNSKRRKR